ncbi:hypothetical protein SAMN05444678_10586 [Sphingomonas sp. YR710]|nr:hypothetical protein SAMN05444678_10586 [Sphingomonas sp. YR710]
MAARGGRLAWVALGEMMNIRGAGLSGKEKQKAEAANDISTTKPSRRKRSDSVRDASVGAALRSAYAEAVNEEIPSEFLDLLRKLD